ncbi:MAG: transcriptional regulator, family [Actinomycetia bacterium]|nr:transcriptional regulator, family [Actinomycetes bacterium]
MSEAEEINPDNSLWDWLAYELRQCRLQAGMSLAQFGQVAGAARSTVSNWETGYRKPDEKNLELVDARFATGGRFLRHLRFARLNHDPSWFAQYSGYERHATDLKIYCGQVIPVPLQTPNYARALLSTGPLELDEALADRLSRQTLILNDHHTPRLWVLFDECLLRQEIGGADIMREQLGHLLKLSELSHVSIRIIPTSAGAHVGVNGEFRISMLPGRDVAFTGAQLSGRLVESPAEVRILVLRFDQIGAQALPEIASRELIRRVMEDLNDHLA